jgi:WD40 repeat protein
MPLSSRWASRTSSKPLAILRGHEKSVTAMDWASNSAVSGLLATGAGDGKICLWRVFPHSLRT